MALNERRCLNAPFALSGVLRADPDLAPRCLCRRWKGRNNFYPYVSSRANLFFPGRRGYTLCASISEPPDSGSHGLAQPESKGNELGILGCGSNPASSERMEARREKLCH